MAISAQGTFLMFKPAGGNQTMVGKLTSVGEISPDSEMVDVTTLESEGGYREYMQGMRDSGEVELTGFFDKSDTGQAALRSAYESGKAGAAEVLFSDGSSVSFSAIVKRYTVGAAEVDGAVGFGAALRITGKVTVSA